MIEVIALWHDLVLTPGTVGVVFLFQIRLRTSDCLRTGGCYENLAPHRHLNREWPAVILQRPLVQIHLPFDRRQCVMRIDVPAIADTGCAPDRYISIGTDPDRRCWLLQRSYRAVRVVKFEIRPLHGDEVLGPQT